MKIKEFLKLPSLTILELPFTCPHEPNELLELMWEDLSFFLDRLHELTPKPETGLITSLIACFIHQATATEDSTINPLDQIKSLLLKTLGCDEATLLASLILDRAEKILEYAEEPRYILKSHKSIVSTHAQTGAYLLSEAQEKSEVEITADREAFFHFYTHFFQILSSNWDLAEPYQAKLPAPKAVMPASALVNPKDIRVQTVPDTEEFQLHVIALTLWIEPINDTLCAYGASDFWHTALTQAFSLRETGDYRDAEGQLRMGYTLTKWTDPKVQFLIDALRNKNFRSKFFSAPFSNPIIARAIFHFFEYTQHQTLASILNFFEAIKSRQTHLVHALQKKYINFLGIARLAFTTDTEPSSIVMQMNSFFAQEDITELFETKAIRTSTLVKVIIYNHYKNLISDLAHGLELKLSSTLAPTAMTVALRARKALVTVLIAAKQIDRALIYALELYDFFQSNLPIKRGYISLFEYTIHLIALHLKESTALNHQRKAALYEEASNIYLFLKPQIDYTYYWRSNLALTERVAYLIQQNGMSEDTLKLFGILQMRVAHLKSLPAQEILPTVYYQPDALDQAMTRLEALFSQQSVSETTGRPAKRKFALVLGTDLNAQQHKREHLETAPSSEPMTLE